MTNLATFQKYYNVCKIISRACTVEGVPADKVTVRISEAEFVELSDYADSISMTKKLELPIMLEMCGIRLEKGDN